MKNTANKIRRYEWRIIRRQGQEEAAYTTFSNYEREIEISLESVVPPLQNQNSKRECGRCAGTDSECFY